MVFAHNSTILILTVRVGSIFIMAYVIKSERGNDVLIDKFQYMYYKHGENKSGSTIYWECSQRKQKKCKARLHAKASMETIEVLKYINEHSHSSSKDVVDAKATLSTLKRTATTSHQTSRTLISQATASLDVATLAQLPTVSSISRNVRKWRQKTANFPAVSLSVPQMVNEEEEGVVEYTKTELKEEFDPYNYSAVETDSFGAEKHLKEEIHSFDDLEKHEENFLVSQDDITDEPEVFQGLTNDPGQPLPSFSLSSSLTRGIPSTLSSPQAEIQTRNYPSSPNHPSPLSSPSLPSTVYESTSSSIKSISSSCETVVGNVGKMDYEHDEETHLDDSSQEITPAAKRTKLMDEDRMRTLSSSNINKEEETFIVEQKQLNKIIQSALICSECEDNRIEIRSVYKKQELLPLTLYVYCVGCMKRIGIPHRALENLTLLSKFS